MQASKQPRSPEQEALLAIVQSIVEVGRLLVAENKAHEKEEARPEANLAETRKRALGSTYVNAGASVASSTPEALSRWVEPDIVRIMAAMEERLMKRIAATQSAHSRPPLTQLRVTYAAAAKAGSTAQQTCKNTYWTKFNQIRIPKPTL